MIESPLIAPFSDWITNQTGRLRALSVRTPVIGWFCTYTPIEIIHAAGFLPLRISGEPGPIRKAYSLAPPFICLYMRRALEKALEGQYDFLFGVIQGYTCDVACGMANIWRENLRYRLHHTLALPYNQNPEAREFFRASLLELVQRLNAAGGRFSLEALDRSLELFGSIRSRLLDLYERRDQHRLPLSTGDLLRVVSAGFSMPPEAYLDRLNDLASSLPDQDFRGADRGFPILISGSLAEDPGVLETLETLGFRISADDLCTGWRSFYPPDGEGEDPQNKSSTAPCAACPARPGAGPRIVFPACGTWCGGLGPAG